MIIYILNIADKIYIILLYVKYLNYEWIYGYLYILMYIINIVIPSSKA